MFRFCINTKNNLLLNVQGFRLYKRLPVTYSSVYKVILLDKVDEANPQ